MFEKVNIDKLIKIKGDRPKKNHYLITDIKICYINFDKNKTRMTQNKKTKKRYFSFFPSGRNLNPKGEI